MYMKTHKEYIYGYFLNLINDTELAEILTEAAHLTNVACGECILEAGNRTNEVCLIASGLVRGYYIDEDGNDRTKCFSQQGDWCCSYNYLSEMSCPFFLEAEESTVLAKFYIPDIETIKEKYPVLKSKIEELLADSMMESEKRIYSFISLEARERYQLLMKEQPELIKRAKQEHIASYLGITPSSLSRIKRNL